MAQRSIISLKTSLYISLVLLSSYLATSSAIDDPSSAEVLVGNKLRVSAICPNGPANANKLTTKLSFISANDGLEVSIRHMSGRQNSDPSQGTIKRLSRAGFNAALPTLLYLHAYTQDAQSDWLKSIRKSYANELKEQGYPDYNLMFLDWSNYSKLRYKDAVSYVPHIGKVLGAILSEMSIQLSYNLDQLHIVSYSLGTHISGVAGKEVLKKFGSRKIGQITAIDPTNVCFHNTVSNFGTKYGLEATDANLVVARHYDAIYGPNRAIGGIDIYINGGRAQPTKQRGRSSSNYRFWSKREAEDENLLSSATSSFSHRQAAVHESRMDMEERQLGCQAMAYSCRSYSAYLKGECASCGEDGQFCYYLNSMGLLRQPTNGSYLAGTRMYIKTGAGPFCLHLHQLVVRLRPSASTRTRSELEGGLVSMDLFGVKSRPSNKLHNNESVYTSLVESRNALYGLQTATLSVEPTGDGKARAFEILRDIERVDLNYMSRATAKGRLDYSMSLCPSVSASDPKFVRC